MTYYHRRLPHWQPTGADLFVTWRLHGSLPSATSVPPQNASPGESFVHYDRILDSAQSGPIWLADERIANCVLAVLQEAQRNNLLQINAFALMANHVHLLLAPFAPLQQITQRIKGATAHRANEILRRAGNPFWQHESYDHWVRSPEERQRIRSYIERNPVSAGLVALPEDYQWSSASKWRTL